MSPVYDYECPECKEVIEIDHGINDDPRIVCSKCNKKMARLISGGGGVIFKGDGFYVNDYTTDPKKKREQKRKG